MRENKIPVRSRTFVFFQAWFHGQKRDFRDFAFIKMGEVGDGISRMSWVLRFFNEFHAHTAAFVSKLKLMRKSFDY